MTSRDPHGDDWIEVLGGLLVALVNFFIVLPIRLVIDLVRWQRRKGRGRP